MNKRVYEFFIGLLALMLALLLLVDMFIKLPKEFGLTFYYIDNIVRIIFIFDYMVRLYLDRDKIKFVKKNKIDLLTIFPLRYYAKFISNFDLVYFVSANILVKILEFFMLIILLVKSKKKTKEEIKVNKVYNLLIVSTVIIIVGAVVIALVEGISLSDALWWSFVTYTTVGYGDVLLKTQLGKFIAAILMILGVGIIGITSTTLALNIINGKGNRKNNESNNIIEGVKIMLDSYDMLSDEDIDNITKIVKSARNNKRDSRD